MIGDLIFATKMLIVTIVILFVMQIHVGPASLEDRAYTMIHSSSLTHYLQRVADGGARLWGDVSHKMFGTRSGSHSHKREP